MFTKTNKTLAGVSSSKLFRVLLQFFEVVYELYLRLALVQLWLKLGAYLFATCPYSRRICSLEFLACFFFFSSKTTKN